MDKRFWSQVVVKSKNECWVFKNQPSQIYGVYHYKIEGGRKAVRPHRYAWIQHNGKIPDGLFVCHSCDTPKCCNPNHLWLGTNSDNILDRVMKFGPCSIGHITTMGEDHHSSKLTKDQVLDIRKRIKNGEKQNKLATKYNVSTVMISKIHLRKSWKHI